MGLFKISNGPWKQLFSGKFQDLDADIFMNDENILLSVIYEKDESGKTTGSVIEMFKVFASIGETEGFVETLPREVIVLTKHSKKETIKYFLVESLPAYVKYDEETFIRDVDDLLKKLNTAASLIKDVSKAYNLELKNLSQCDDNVKEGFFTLPLLIPVALTASHISQGAAAEKIISESSFAAMPAAKGEIVLGLTKEKVRVTEPLSMFSHTIVSGGGESERKAVLHVLAESAMLSNIPVVVLDWEQNFDGLGEANKERDEIQKYQVNLDPLGFPIKEFHPIAEFAVDAKLVNFSGTMKLFGVGDEKIIAITERITGQKKFEDLEDLAREVNAQKGNEKEPDYLIKKTVRILRLINMRYSRLFDGSNNMDEIIKPGQRGLSRAAILELKEPDNREKLLLAHSIISGVLEKYKKEGKTRSLRAIFVIPGCEKIFPFQGEEESPLYKDMENTMLELADYGVGFFMGTEKQANLSTKIWDFTEAKMNVVSGNDIGVQIKDRKAYRVLVRPGLSLCK